MIEPKETRSTCPYCGVGCGVIIESRGDEITGVRGDPNHPANLGKLCTKGSTLHLTARKVVQLQTRLLVPQLRTQRDELLKQTSWDEAAQFVADKILQTVQQHGPDSIGLYISGQLLTEDYYVFNKLAKGLLGTNNIDTNSRLCMSSAVAGYKKTLGADSVPCSYEDIDHAGMLLIAGSNTAFAHPILYRRIEGARANNPQLKVIVVDPRRTDTAQEADLHLPIAPGTDVALLHAMLHVMLWEGWTDNAYIAAHTEGFDALKTLVREMSPDKAASICGVAKEKIIEAARLFATNGPALSLYCQGLNQSADGTNKNAAIINLHLATGQIGKPGAGPFSLTGQPNAMGGREVGGLANLLPAHRDLANPQHREETARLWGVESVPTTSGKTAVEMFEAARAGKIKVLWIACTNPAQSLPDQRMVREALEAAELVIVQEAFGTTATARYADVLLPATTWGEKDGTVTNSERCISRQRAAVPPMGQARHDWQIVVDVARRIEAQLVAGTPTPTVRPEPVEGHLRANREVNQWASTSSARTDLGSSPDSKPKTTLFPYESAEHIWSEHRETTRGTDCDITGMSYPMLEAASQQWPLREGESIGKKRLFEDGTFYTASGKAQFYAQPYKPVADTVDARYPLALTTGRLRDQWHGMSRTGLVPQLFAHAPEPAIEMHAGDMARRSLKDGDLVNVTSRRGTQLLPVRSAESVASGRAFVAMHWGDEFLSGGADDGTGGLGVNALTSPAIDVHSKQPELKHAAVKVIKAELPWRMVAFCWLPDEAAWQISSALSAQLKQVAYGSVVRFGRERCGMLVRAAHHSEPSADWLTQLAQVLGLTKSANVLSYADKRIGIERRVRVHKRSAQDVQLEAAWLIGDTQAEPWLKAYLESGDSVAALGRLLLSPGAVAPAGYKQRGKMVCNCFNVTEDAIITQLSHYAGPAESKLAALQNTLQCGTNCGSCVPELKRLVQASVQAA
ncbi:MAG: molybdopterin-dependent oxidoreductase [Burkholderiaceae bacterium]